MEDLTITIDLSFFIAFWEALMEHPPLWETVDDNVVRHTHVNSAWVQAYFMQLPINILLWARAFYAGKFDRDFRGESGPSWFFGLLAGAVPLSYPVAYTIRQTFNAVSWVAPALGYVLWPVGKVMTWAIRVGNKSN